MKHSFVLGGVLLGVLIGAGVGGMVIARRWQAPVFPVDWVTNDAQGSGGDDVRVPEESDPILETVSASGNIVVTSPSVRGTVGLPLVIRGRARVFESTLNYKLLDEDGSVLVEGNAMSNAEDVGEFGSFVITTNYDAPSGATGTVQVFDYSAKDGSVIDLASVPVQFSSVASLTLKTFWSPSGETMVCAAVTPTERRVPYTLAVAHAALTELLGGTNTPERMQGLTSSIPEGVTIKSLTIIDGVAKVEFSHALETGGSCRVAAIRAQIESTLKQFPTVTSVVISTEGNTPEESLQP